MDHAKDETKKCENCDKEIAIANFHMHELHCKRHLVKCPKCGDAVPKASLQEHDETEHKLVKCKHCSSELYENDMDDHQMNYCSERPVICSYCDLQFPLSQLKDHENVCGSRTDVCEKCQSTVMLKNMLKHESSQCRDFATDQHQPKGRAPQRNHDVSMPPFLYPFMQFQEQGAMKRLPKINNSQANQLTSIQRFQDQFPNNTGEYTQSKNPRRNSRPTNGTSKPPSKPQSKPHSNTSSKSFQPPGFDVRPRYSDAPMPHTSRREDSAAENFGSNRKRVTNRKPGSNAPRQPKPQVLKTTNVKAVSGSASSEQMRKKAIDEIPSEKQLTDIRDESTNMLETIAHQDCAPCEFCNAQLPIDLLLRHQDACAEGMRFDGYGAPILENAPQDRGPKPAEQQFKTQEPSPYDHQYHDDDEEDESRDPAHHFRQPRSKPSVPSSEPSHSASPSQAMMNPPSGSQMYLFSYGSGQRAQGYEEGKGTQQYGDASRQGHGPRYLLFIPPAPTSDEEDEEYASCEHCEFPIPLRDLTRHELVCKKAPQVPMPDRKPPVAPMTDRNSLMGPMSDRSELDPADGTHFPLSPTTRSRFETMGYDDWSERQTPLRYANPLTSYSNYDDYYHQSSTDNGMISCDFCSNSFPRKVFAQHELTCKGNKQWGRNHEGDEDDSPESSTNADSRPNSSGRDRGLEGVNYKRQTDYAE